MSFENQNENPEIDFSLEQQKLEAKINEYRTSGEEKGEEWANKIQQMFDERKKAIIEASKTVDEDRSAFDKAWEDMNDFVREELQPGI